MLLKCSTKRVKLCTCCYNLCFSSSAVCIIDFNRDVSFSAGCLSSLASITRLFDSSNSAVRLSLSVSNCAVTTVKLISGLTISYSFRRFGQAIRRKVHTLVPSPSTGVFDSRAGTASNDIPIPRYNSLYLPMECLLRYFSKRYCFSESTRQEYGSSGLGISRTSAGSIEIPSLVPYDLVSVSLLVSDVRIIHI